MRTRNFPSVLTSVSYDDRLAEMGCSDLIDADQQFEDVERTLAQLAFGDSQFQRDLTLAEAEAVFSCSLGDEEFDQVIDSCRQAQVKTLMGLVMGLRPQLLLDGQVKKSTANIRERLQVFLQKEPCEADSLNRLLVMPHDALHWALARYLSLQYEPTFLCGPDRADLEYFTLLSQLPPQLAVYCHSQTLFEEMLVALWGGQKVLGQYRSLLLAVMDKETMKSFRDSKLRRRVDGGEYQDQIFDDLDRYDADCFEEVLALYKKMTLLYSYISVLQYVQCRPEYHQFANVLVDSFLESADWLMKQPLPALDVLALQVFDEYRDGSNASPLLFEMFRDMNSGELKALLGTLGVGL